MYIYMYIYIYIHRAALTGRQDSASLQGPAGFFFTSSLTGGRMR